MYKYEIQTLPAIPERQEEKQVGIICDKCKVEHLYKNNYKKIANFHEIKFSGGYASKFGDMDYIQVDFCDDCYFELISPYMRKTEWGKNDIKEREIEND